MSLLGQVKIKYNSLSTPIKATFWYTFCNFFNKAIALLTTPIFTRIMTPDQYGTFAIFQSWFNILIIFTSLNLFMSSYMKGLLKYKNDQNNFTSSQLFLSTLITSTFMVIYGIASNFWTSIFNLHPILMFAMFAELLFMPAYELWIARKRFEYKYKSAVIVSILMNVICLITSVIAVLLTEHKVEARVFSDVGIKLLFILPLFVSIFIRGKKFINLKYWKFALLFNLPLIPHYLSNFILTQSDRIMIGQIVGDAQAGYYSVSYTISTVVLLLITAINSALTPYIYQALDEIDKAKIKKIKGITNGIAILISALCVLVMLFAPEIIKVFAGAEYLDAIYIIPPVTASVYFVLAYSVFSNIEYFYQKTKKIAVATTICAILNIILNYICIQKFGYYAAGYTTLVCYILLAIMHYIFYNKLIQEKMPTTRTFYNAKLIATFGIMLTIFTIAITLVYQYSILRYIIAVTIIVVVVIQRKRINHGVKLLVGGDHENNQLHQK